MKKEVVIIILIIILSLLFISGCLDKKEEMIHVNINGGGDFNNIQEAIENVAIGSTIYVDEGSYYESLTITKPINLIGDDNGKTIIIQSNVDNAHDSIISIYANNCVIKGFNIVCYNTLNTKVIGINISSSYNLISNNIISGSDKGIYLTKTSGYNNILDNNFLNSSNGIYGFSSDNNNISKNNINLCESYGIYIIASDNNLIFDNNVSDNNYGMRIMNSENNIVYDNSIMDNNRGVLCCCSSTNNTIYDNMFKQNKIWNAADEINNQWDNGKIGNYWDDYVSKYPNAEQRNGIWDTAYNIEEGDNIDRYPLVNPPEL